MKSRWGVVGGAVPPRVRYTGGVETPQTPARSWGRHGFRLDTSHGSSHAFHHRNPAEDAGPELWLHVPQRPALVLGSTQPDELVDREGAEAAGIEVCRRRSGGGLVLVDPAGDCWIDVIVPRGHALWDDDVGRAFHWLGKVWAEVLADAVTPVDPAGGPAEPVVHHRSDGRAAIGRVWCFGALGHGEVTIDGSKVVGLSQRRTRNHTRLQALVTGPWTGAVLSRHVDRPVAERLLDPDHDPLPDPTDLAAGLPSRFRPFNPSLLANRFIAAMLDH